MKKTIAPKKLTLSKKTILKLSVSMLDRMEGGVWGIVTRDPNDPKCVSVECPSVAPNISCNGNCNSVRCSEPGCKTF